MSLGQRFNETVIGVSCRMIGPPEQALPRHPASQRHRYRDGDRVDFGLAGIIRLRTALGLANCGTRIDFEDHFAGLHVDGADETPQ